jgi:HK97 family phage portal protein
MDFDLGRAFATQAQTKALAPHPALMDRSVPVSVYSPGANRRDAVLSQREAGRHGQAYGGVEAIDHVYDCIGLYADPAGTAPYSLRKQSDHTKLVRTKSKGTPPDYEIGPEDLYKLLAQPNPFMLYDELMMLLVIDLLLVGNGYWMKWMQTSDGKPLALYRLAPAHVKVVPGPFGPEGYEYQPPGVRDPIKIVPKDIIHFRRPNPHSAYYGMGVIQGAGRSMDLELAITDTMASYYENRADPSMIVQSDRRVPRDVFNKLRAQLRQRVAGTSRAGELLVLEAGLKASTLDTSAKDALFDALSKMSRDRIYSKFRASATLFGLMTESGGSNKVSDARREFDNYALRPFLDRLQRVITSSLTAAWGCEFIIDYRTLLPPEEAVKVGGEIAKLPGIKVRELRRQYSQFGIEESTGDAEIDELILNLPGEELDENGQGGFADRPLPGEPGRPPLGENTKPINRNSTNVENARVRQGKALQTFAEIEARLAALGYAEKAVTNSAGENVTVGNRLQGEQIPADQFAAARQVDIDAARDFITAGLRDATRQLERDLLDHVEGKALKTSDLVGRIRRSEAWKTFRDRVTEVLEEGARRAVISGVMHSGRTPEDDVDYDEIARSVVHRPEGLRSIMRTIRDRVVKRVKETREEHGERSDFDAAIRASLADWAADQALTIADSEATEAYNEATLTALEMSGDSEVYVLDGDEHDEPCVLANGQVWEIGYARQHRKEHPRCRRAFLGLGEAAAAEVL